MTRLQLEGYPLDPVVADQIKQLIGETGELSQQGLWNLMDQAWSRHGCSQDVYDPSRYQNFYSDSIWTINGLYSEQDSLFQCIRRDIVQQVLDARAEVVLDWGGGIGTLARMVAQQKPGVKVDILEPHPSELGLSLCRGFDQISYIATPLPSHYDFVICTDVL